VLQVGTFLQHSATFVVGFIIAFTRSWDMTLVLVGCLPFLAGVGGILAKLITTLSNKATAAYTEVGRSTGHNTCSWQGVGQRGCCGAFGVRRQAGCSDAACFRASSTLSRKCNQCNNNTRLNRPNKFQRGMVVETLRY
jgi:ABC-type multidrug transport system fused ATPase/permease subunit